MATHAVIIWNTLSKWHGFIRSCAKIKLLVHIIRLKIKWDKRRKPNSTPKFELSIDMSFDFLWFWGCSCWCGHTTCRNVPKKQPIRCRSDPPLIFPASKERCTARTNQSTSKAPIHLKQTLFVLECLHLLHNLHQRDSLSRCILGPGHALWPHQGRGTKHPLDTHRGRPWYGPIPTNLEKHPNQIPGLFGYRFPTQVFLAVCANMS